MNQPSVPSQAVTLVAAGALIDTDGRVLVAQRPEGTPLAALWEFPGGKVEAGETPDLALRREIREELGVILCPTCFQPLTFVCHGYEERDVLILLYLCRRWEGIPQTLHHAALKWLRPDALLRVAMPEANRPLAAAVRDALAGG